jgi:hypothetical protein
MEDILRSNLPDVMAPRWGVCWVSHEVVANKESNVWVVVQCGSGCRRIRKGLEEELQKRSERQEKSYKLKFEIS